MLKLRVHSGLLAQRSQANQLATLDIAYAKQAVLADYVIAYSARGKGEMPPDAIAGYPRWSASLWDLTARALTRVLYRDDQPPASAKPDARCAYATKLCAVIEVQTQQECGAEIATVQIEQRQGRRGLYTADFWEDILGPKQGKFTYGCKTLEPADLLLRAICWAYYGQDGLGPKPALALPGFIKEAGIDKFHVEGVPEPAKTGYLRFLAREHPGTDPALLQDAKLYAEFLMRG
jgi:hypothetical protein